MRTSPGRFWGIISAATAAALVAGFFVLSGGGPAHELTFTVPEAASIIKGQNVFAGGSVVGKVTGVELAQGGRAARVRFSVDDESVWPLRRSSRLALRWGGSVSFLNRRVEITPGPPKGPVYADGATVPRAAVTVPEELDTVVGTLNGKARDDLRTFIGKSGPAFDKSQEGLQRSLQVAPPALAEASDLLNDLTADRRSLDTMLTTTADVVSSVHRADPSLSRLLEGAAGSFDAVADEESNLRTMLERLPAALGQINETVSHVDTTLGAAADLTDRLEPGVARLRAVARPLNSVLSTLVSVSPDVLSTLQTVSETGPRINRFVGKVSDVSPLLKSTLAKANGQLDCLRPYTPELTGLFVTWADFLGTDDGKDKFVRAQVENFLPAATNDNPYTPAQAVAAYPGLRYAFPRPPGLNAGQPWFQPKCGVGREVLDPAQDQESQVQTTRGTP